MTVVFNQRLVDQMEQPPKSMPWLGNNLAFIKLGNGNYRAYSIDDEQPQRLTVQVC